MQSMKNIGQGKSSLCHSQEVCLSNYFIRGREKNYLFYIVVSEANSPKEVFSGISHRRSIF